MKLFAPEAERADGIMRGLRVGDVAGVDGAIYRCVLTAVGSGRGREKISSAMSFLHFSLLISPPFRLPLDVSFNAGSMENNQ